MQFLHVARWRQAGTCGVYPSIVGADVICGGGRDSGKLSRLRYTPRLPKHRQWLSPPSSSHDHHLAGLSSIAMRLAAYTGVSDVSEREWQLSRTPADFR